MPEESASEPENRVHEMLGFLGVALAVLGIVDLPMPLRLGCLIFGSLFLSISFQLQTEWPRAARWLLSLFTTIFMALVAWSATNH